ncbi:hypothetical protein OS125_02815 [Corynebacterium sp. P7003]|uniref:Secreted protein n=1 Tax=Corynebacterium pygosceleis TaxID=2800406 RepID=A0ABT3WPN2_9CORY|nr:hypothetical protein [Corynebacterium pygosceleis]MCX7444180.1 hypothetical protein [Corynebacterium pygosceleis]
MSTSLTLLLSTATVTELTATSRGATVVFTDIRSLYLPAGGWGPRSFSRSVRAVLIVDPLIMPATTGSVTVSTGVPAHRIVYGSKVGSPQKTSSTTCLALRVTLR